MRLRLTRVGSRKNPVWRVVAADGRAKRDGRVLETVGRYNPQRQPSEIVLDRERIDHWLARGAQPSDTVRKLIRAVERGAPPESAAVAEPAPAAGETASAATPDGGESASAPTAGGTEVPSEATSGDPATGEETGGDSAAAGDPVSVAEAAPADEGAAAGESEG